MSLKDAPIRRKLMVIILLTTVTALLLMRGTLLTYEFLRFQQSTTRQLATVGKIIAANSTAALAFANPTDAAETLSALKAEPYITAAALYDNEGKLFSKYPGNLADAALPAAPQPDGIRPEHSFLVGFQPVVQGDKRLGTLYLRFDIGTLESEWLRLSIGIALAVIAAVLLAAYLLSRKLQQQISLPILALAETAQAISERRDYSVRARKFGADELGLLTDAFNQMLADIGKREKDLHEEISERRQAEDRLKMSLKEVGDLRAALDEHAIVAITDAQGKITYVNDKFCAISKYSRAELLGQDHRIINSGFHPKEFIRDIWTTIARGKVWHGEIKNKAKDGSFYWVDTTIVPFLNDDGKPRQYVAIRADITERKRAEEQLKASFKEIGDLKAALDEHAIVAITDAQGKINYVNDKFCAISKYSRAELLGQDHRIINSGFHPKEFIRDIWTTIARGKVWHGEIKNKAKDGSFYWVDTTIVPFLNDDGKPRQYVAIRADITERKRAEEQLKASFKEIGDLKAALDEHAIVAITDAQGKITFVNDKFCAISKYSRAELLGQDHRIINSGFHPKEFIRDIWTTIARGKVWHGEIKNKAKDGSFYWVDTTIVPFLNDDGKPRQYVAIRADITERKRAEAEIVQINAELEQRVVRRTAELEAANKELEAFSYSISHDLRAPLRAMNGFAGIVLEDFGPQLPAEGRGYLERIRRGSQRMGELIDDLLAFSRLSRQPVNRQPVNSTALVQEALELLKPQRENREVELLVGELPACQADPVLLKQVWVNLLSNAMKYSRDRQPARVEAGGRRENGETIFFVRDNGVGFDMQYANKLFGVFQRLHRADEFEGTGVGLAIVQRIVHRHGGRVWAEAQLGQGATFYFTIEGETKPESPAGVENPPLRPILKKADL